MNAMRTAGLFLSLLLLTGCGGSTATGPQQEDERITALVSGTPDKAMNAKLAKDHFATVPTKDELRKYAQLSFEVTGSPRVAGDSATVPVRVLSQDGKPLGETTWEFTKSGEQWKIKSAPLP